MRRKSAPKAIVYGSMLGEVACRFATAIVGEFKLPIRQQLRFRRNSLANSERLEERLVLSHLGDPAILVGFTADPALNGIQSQPPGENTGSAPSGFASYSTLANGMPVLSSLPAAPTAIYLDFDGDASGSNPYTAVVNPYSEDTDATTFNVAEQRSIHEAWRQASTYFAMFNTNVTTVMPATSIPKAWLAVGNNISGGYSYVGVFPNTTPESWNQSSDARTRVSGLTHELGHNFGLQHQATYDQWGNLTAEYASATDPLHGALMGVDYSGTIHKFIMGHNSTSSGVTTLQDDVAVIANKIKTQPGGGDGFRVDDFTNTIATAAMLPTSGAAQWTSAVIERLGDVDAFSFTSAGGSYAISAAPDTPSGVDLKLDVYASDGSLIASQDSANTVQQLSLDLAPGSYYALVSSHQNYGDLGRYFLSVSPLPAGWKTTEVGLGTSGYVVYDAVTGIFNPVGSGGGLTSSSDGFQYAYQTLNGDGSIVARVANVDNTSANAVVGLTMRESTAANALHVSVGRTYGSGPRQFVRSSTGGSTTTTTATAGASGHTWLKLQRLSNVFTTFTSADGATWTQLSTATVSMSSSVTVGLLTASANIHAMNVGELDNVAVTRVTTVTSPVYNILPAPTGLAVTLGTGSGLDLAWGSVSNATGYSVSRSTDGVNFTQIGTTTGATTYSDPNLTGSARYFYRVSATDASGSSTPSGISSLVNRPSAVTGLSITKPSTTQLVVNWTETTGETGYRVQRSSDGGATYTTVATVGANVPSYTDSGLTSGLAYSYLVTPTSALGDGVSSTAVSGAPRLAAVTPTIGTVAPGSITVNWTNLSNETGYRIERSTNGTTFTTLANVLADVVSYVDTTVASATEYFYRVFGTTSLTQSLNGTMKFAASASTSPPPAPWTSADVGSVSGAGATDLTSGTFKQISSGTIIGGTSDSGRFTSQPLSGNGQLVARVSSVENTGTNASAGVMIRQSTAANSANAYVYVTPTTIGFSYRATSGGSTTTVATVAATAPRWVKLDRTGNSFSAFYSSDGVSWTQIGSSATISMTSSTVAGLASTAGVTTTLCTSTFTNVQVSVPSGLSVGDVTQSEGNSGPGSFAFDVSLSSASSSTVSVSWSTADGTAASGTDFTAASGTLTFNPGETSKTVLVSVNGDYVSEANETFSVNLSNPVNSLIVDGQGLGTIQNDDIAGISVSAPTSTSTTEIGGEVSFTVVLNSEPLFDVTIPISSSDETEGTVSPSSLIFTAANWNIAQTVTVTGVDDAVYDGNQAYTVVIGTATSQDSLYNNLNPADIGLTNLDNDPIPATGFYVVDDGTVDRTYEYSATGAASVNYAINSGNTAPRGMATTASGTKVWVADKNRKVYVYDDAGFLLGSWTAGTLASTAVVEGIATDGTSIWIVDSKSDKVFYYANAAGLLSGTATATSFALNSGNLNSKGIVYGTDGTNRYLWVVNDSTTDKVFRYQVTASTGGITYLNDWTLNSANAAPTGLTVEASQTSGDIWVVDSATDRVYQYTNGRTATAPTLAGSFALAPGNTNPQGIADPGPPKVYAPGVTVSSPSSNNTTEAGGTATFTVTLDSPPTATVTIAITSSDITEGIVSPTSLVSLVFTAANWDVAQTVTVTGQDDSETDGNVAYNVVLGQCVSDDLLYSSIDPSDIALTNLDNEGLYTKFYVVDDGTVDTTYEYSASGMALTNYSINTGNTAPRGMATTAAGNKVWVADKNRKVYVYDAAGLLLGSWSAGTLASNAAVEGIATDGTNIWIVDSRSDKVFYYANAAGLLSGTATATSFALNSGNLNSKGIVYGTDGTNRYLWVVNDTSSTDRVFRYPVNPATGGITSTTQTSWSLATANALPTGLTVDPSQTSGDIWVVDSGTDRVYQYTDGRTAAAPALAGSFALAAGNTNPQGIADPPPPGPVADLPKTAAGSVDVLARGGFSGLAAIMPATRTNDQFLLRRDVSQLRTNELNALPPQRIESRLATSAQNGRLMHAARPRMRPPTNAPSSAISSLSSQSEASDDLHQNVDRVFVDFEQLFSGVNNLGL